MVASSIDSDLVILRHGFAPWTDVVGRESVVEAFRRLPGRSGVYVLGFADGSRYLGRSKDVLRRYDQHRAKHPDITLLTFRAVDADEQARVERELIHTLEVAGVRLRNKAEMSVVAGPSRLDELIGQDAQQTWVLTGVQPAEDGPSVDDESLRLRHRRDFMRFRNLAVADGVIRVLSQYLDIGLPLPRRTELSSWSLSCLPSGGQALVRLNLHMQEVLTVGSEPPSFFVSLHLARSPFEDRLGSRWQHALKQQGYEVDMHRYAPGGQDQFNLVAVGEAASLDVLSSDLVAEAVRIFNLNLMRKGPSFWRSSHCADLADAAHAAVSARETTLAR